MWENIKFSFGILVIFKVQYIITFNVDNNFMANEVELSTFDNDSENDKLVDERNKTRFNKYDKFIFMDPDNTTTTSTEKELVDEIISDNNDTPKYYEVTSILNEDEGKYTTTEAILELTRTSEPAKMMNTRISQDTEKDKIEATEIIPTRKTINETNELSEVIEETDILLTEQVLNDTTEVREKNEKSLTEISDKEVSESEITNNNVTKYTATDIADIFGTREDADVAEIEITDKTIQSDQDTIDPAKKEISDNIEEPTRFILQTDTNKSAAIDSRRDWVPSDVKNDSNILTKMDMLRQKVFEKTKHYFHKVNDAMKFPSKKEQTVRKNVFTFLKKFVSQANSCAHYKQNPKEFNMDAMVDVWQTLYYQLVEKVFCFKIYIRKLTEEDKEDFAQSYGNFSGNVDWSKCNLEIKSAEKLDRKHFLQGTNNDDGVFQNVIIMEDKYNEPPYLKEETPDQWMVVKSLLLMRDCKTGGVLVFSRFPHQPERKAILEGLQKFGETERNGRMACEENEVAGKNYGDEYTSSEFLIVD